MSNAVLMNAHTGSLSSHFTAAHSASAMPYRESTTTLTNDDFCKNVTFKFSKSTWVNRLLGIAGAKHSKERQTIENQTSMPPTPETYPSSSPWVLPVYVLSTRQDTDKHHIPMEAKCHLDTGNMQGNLVSRRFVEDVLGYPKSAFCSLTKEEEVGATGITGHRLMPEAAIYLTWYHKKSIRVFRNMRFLVSPTPHFDVIIGAGSIQEDGLLDVPNFSAHDDVIFIDIKDALRISQEEKDPRRKMESLITKQISELTTKINGEPDQKKKTELKEIRQRFGQILEDNDEFFKKPSDAKENIDVCNPILDKIKGISKSPAPINPPDYKE